MKRLEADHPVDVSIGSSAVILLKEFVPVGVSKLGLCDPLSRASSVSLVSAMWPRGVSGSTSPARTHTKRALGYEERF